MKYSRTNSEDTKSRTGHRRGGKLTPSRGALLLDSVVSKNLGRKASGVRFSYFTNRGSRRSLWPLIPNGQHRTYNIDFWLSQLGNHLNQVAVEKLVPRTLCPSSTRVRFLPSITRAVVRSDNLAFIVWQFGTSRSMDWTTSTIVGNHVNGKRYWNTSKNH